VLLNFIRPKQIAGSINSVTAIHVYVERCVGESQAEHKKMQAATNMGM